LAPLTSSVQPYAANATKEAKSDPASEEVRMVREAIIPGNSEGNDLDACSANRSISRGPCGGGRDQPCGPCPGAGGQ
jgi:hypothetical protein